MFDENRLIEEGEKLLLQIEKSLRELKTQYSQALSDFQTIKNNNIEVFEEVEPDYLNLLSKIQKSIRTTTELWDKTIAKLDAMKKQRKQKSEFFLTGVLWSLDQAGVTPEKKTEIVELAKQLIATPKKEQT